MDGYQVPRCFARIERSKDFPVKLGQPPDIQVKPAWLSHVRRAIRQSSSVVEFGESSTKKSV